MTRARFEKLEERLKFAGIADPAAIRREIEIGCDAFRATESEIDQICNGVEQASMRGVLSGEELRSLKETAPFLNTDMVPEEWSLKADFADFLGVAFARLRMSLSDLKSELKRLFFRG